MQAIAATKIGLSRVDVELKAFPCLTLPDSFFDFKIQADP